MTAAFRFKTLHQLGDLRDTNVYRYDSRHREERRLSCAMPGQMIGHARVDIRRVLVVGRAGTRVACRVSVGSLLPPPSVRGDGRAESA